MCFSEPMGIFDGILYSFFANLFSKNCRNKSLKLWFTAVRVLLCKSSYACIGFHWVFLILFPLDVQLDVCGHKEKQLCEVSTQTLWLFVDVCTMWD